MPAPKKMAQVELLTERFTDSSIVVGTGLTNMTASDMLELRRALRAQQLEYRVVKNTLAAIAADRAGRPQIAELLTGQTGLLITTGDALDAVKALEEYRTNSRSALTVLGAFMDGRILTAADVKALALLPPKPQLIASLAGQLQAVLRGVITTLNAPQQQVVSVLNAPLQAIATVLQRYVEIEDAVEQPQESAAPEDQTASDSSTDDSVEQPQESAAPEDQTASDSGTDEQSN